MLSAIMKKTLPAAFIISAECIACGTCKERCPSSAIVEDGENYLITSVCAECGDCLEVCPVGAIVH